MSARVLRLPTAYVGPQEPRFERPVPRKDLAEQIGVCPRTVDRLVKRGMPPDCWISVGAHKRFYVSRVEAWLRGKDSLLDS